MRILLDENVPKPLKYAFDTHAVSTVAEMGWASIKNGKLLALAEDTFDAFVTLDQNLQYQQNLMGRKLIVITLRVKRIKLEFLLPLVPLITQALHQATSGEVVLIE